MVSINTNLSSLMVQSNLTQATNGLNKAIERLSTGYKINHASDNAANYSIANSYESKLSSYEVAASNVQSGLDLLSVAQDTISTMQDHGSRLQALITQARNGTYGAQSLNAMTQEAGAIISEIQRMYTNTEYNGINLFDNLPLPEWAKTVETEAGLKSDITPKYNGFIKNAVTYSEAEIAEMTSISDVDSFVAGKKYSICSFEEFVKFAQMVNEGKSKANVEYVLGSDIDLSSVENWTKIGNSSNQFSGTFNGNGHTIKNLKLNKSATYQGLFGYMNYGAIIKNVRLENFDVKGGSITGTLVGNCSGRISNCSIKDGEIYGTANVGGLVGMSQTTTTIEYCNVESIKVNGSGSSLGGLIGTSKSKINSCYVIGEVAGSVNSGAVGGLAGIMQNNASVTNSYAYGEVSGKERIGGLVGYLYETTSVKNSYADCDISGVTEVGGLIGRIYSDTSVTKSYSKGKVEGTTYVGGLAGQISANSVLSDLYSNASVSGNNNVGGFVGTAVSSINNAFATGDVKGKTGVGGFAGTISNTAGTVDFENIMSQGSVKGSEKSGSLIGRIINTTDGSSFSTININNGIVAKQDMNIIGATCSSASGIPEVEYDMTDWLDNIREINRNSTSIQVGINSDESSRIDLEIGFKYNLNPIFADIKSDRAYNTINSFMNALSEKATELGSVSNRLESSLESIAVNIQNLGDSLSTVKDVDMSEVSSEYIKKQILQQASATLLATANQSPAIALQLI